MESGNSTLGVSRDSCYFPYWGALLAIHCTADRPQTAGCAATSPCPLNLIVMPENEHALIRLQQLAQSAPRLIELIKPPLLDNTT